MNEEELPDYIDVLEQIKRRILNGRYLALRSANRELLNLYRDIGKIIVGKQKADGWGRSLVERLAKDIAMEYPGIRGFSARNLWKMRNFYLTYLNNEKLPPAVAELSWTHNVILIEKCRSEEERAFYANMSLRNGWTKNILIHQIENKSYEKTLSGQTNFRQTLPDKSAVATFLPVKDEYIFDFLDLAEEYTERQLEKALLSRVEHFLREMGGVFSFIGSQYRIEAGDKEYFVDLLLYHRQLRSLVAVELKIGEFMPEHVGKMQFYLAVLDDLVKIDGENPSIGIIICKSKDKTIVEYALRDTKRPMGVASYTITARLPEELKGKMPEPEQMAKLIRS